MKYHVVKTFSNIFANLANIRRVTQLQPELMRVADELPQTVQCSGRGPPDPKYHSIILFQRETVFWKHSMDPSGPAYLPAHCTSENY